MKQYLDEAGHFFNIHPELFDRGRSIMHIKEARLIKIDAMRACQAIYVGDSEVAWGHEAAYAIEGYRELEQLTVQQGKNADDFVVRCFGVEFHARKTKCATNLSVENSEYTLSGPAASIKLTKNNLIKNMLNYWRNCLADEDIMGMAEKNDDLLYIPSGAISDTGHMAEDLSAKLREQWRAILNQAQRDRTSADFEKDPGSNVVPVVLLAKALTPQHTHGVVAGNRKPTISFTMFIPAILSREGDLLPDVENRPWIGREFLDPTTSDGDGVPVIGSIVDFDEWLDRNPIDTSSWTALLQWCDGMWSAVAHDRVPDGFVEIDGMRIRAARTIRDIGQHIRKLYDALLDEKDFPVLLTTVCNGRSPDEIGREDRLRQMDAPRGAMGVAYGLANSQTDAILATTRLRAGEVLAVNGPPGTGKTTLLQGVIATETVRRALEGGDPAIIVGCSTNNQAVPNINRAMNKVLAEDRSGEVFPWARRWVPDAATYGLYLPSSTKASEAEANGFKIAVKNGSTWAGFPERETDEAQVAEAAALWTVGFNETYGGAVAGPESGIDRIRDDLQALRSEMTAVKARVGNWEGVETWWRNRCADIGPEEFIEGHKEVSCSREAVATAGLHECLREEDVTRATWNKAMSNLHHQNDAASKHLAAASEWFDTAALLKSRIELAGTAQGIVELAAEFFPVLRGIAVVRQHARRLAALHEQEKRLFQEVLDVQDRAVWSERARLIVADAERSLEMARSRYNAIATKEQAAEAEKAQAIAAAECAVREAHNKAAGIRAENERDLRTLECKLAELREARNAARSAYEILRRRPAIEYNDKEVNSAWPDWLAIIDRALDVSIRHELFQKSMRYWEGRWIIEAQRFLLNPKKASGQGRTDTLARFRRWCMLTPCLVSTLHSLPKYMRFARFMTQYSSSKEKRFASDFLLGDIDLLIMDEAGQVAPHVGMAAFSLASRAVVVGDVHQIEPVLKITAGTDCANSVRAGLGAMWSDGHPVAPHILSESSDGTQGSVMRVIQAATAFTSSGAGLEPGIFLSEHRRCDPDIIRFCNDLVYKGRLQAISTARLKAPQMGPWGWAHVRGTCVKRNGSRVNELEARVLADWIAKRADGEHGWVAHYQKNGKRSNELEKIVAVITPFAAQAGAIRQALKSKGERFARITVGTVHALQGAECPIVIFSPTYSADTNPSGSMFFDRKPNMLNVAVSRAIDSFIVIGDMRIFRRTGGGRPSSFLAKFLFNNPDNELVDVDGNYGFTPEVLKKAERISTLDRHRAVLSSAFRSVKDGELLMVVSPFISRLAVEFDDVAGLCRLAASNGGHVHIVVEQRSANDQTRGAPEALAALQNAGAAIHRIPAIHSKTLVVADREIVEGSFNWLSATRDRTSRYCSYEASYLVSGASAKADIERAVRELVQLGAKIP